jgi:hypothetical protein
MDVTKWLRYTFVSSVVALLKTYNTIVLLEELIVSQLVKYFPVFFSGRKYCHIFWGVAWLIKRVLDLMIEFTGPLYDLLQHFTKHYLRLDSLDLWPLH